MSKLQELISKRANIVKEYNRLTKLIKAAEKSDNVYYCKDPFSQNYYALKRKEDSFTGILINTSIRKISIIHLSYYDVEALMNINIEDFDAAFNEVINYFNTYYEELQAME